MRDDVLSDCLLLLLVLYDRDNRKPFCPNGFWLIKYVSTVCTVCADADTCIVYLSTCIYCMCILKYVCTVYVCIVYNCVHMYSMCLYIFSG